MREEYMEPVMEVIEFDNEDVILTSVALAEHFFDDLADGESE